MSEAQKVLIERAGWACVSHLQMADALDRAGRPDLAAKRREAAGKSSELAFFLAAVSTGDHWA